MRGLMTYRRRNGSDCWHYVAHCRWWPVSPKHQFVERDTKPSGEFCNECRSKRKADAKKS
jgi:hypothetical protein